MGRDRAARQGRLARDELERAPHGRLALGVGHVREQDHAQPELRHPAHERAEAGQATRMAHVALAIALVPDHQAVAVAADHAGRLGQRGPLDGRREGVARPRQSRSVGG